MRTLLCWVFLTCVAFAQSRPDGRPMIYNEPRAITAYPLDVVDVTINATNFPPLWVWTDTEELESDYSITLDNTSFSAYRPGLVLRSGHGTVEFTLNSKCLPGATQSLGFWIATEAAGTNLLEIRFKSNEYKIYRDGGTLLQTTSYTAASGDRIKLELFGSALRIYINDVSIYTYDYADTSPYPARYAAVTFAALATSVAGYQIPAPVLTGDWQVADTYLRWDVPAALGTYTTLNSERTARITVDDTPGNYTVTGIIGQYADLDPAFHNTSTDSLFVGQVFAVNDAVIFGTTPGETLPGGITAGTTYYVKTVVGGNITVSLTQGGSTVDITSAGTGGWVAHVGRKALQQAETVVTVPAFDVLGVPSGNIELQPGEVVTFKTTYDRAQNFNNGSYITRTVVTGGGDSFSSTTGAYTAPTTAGTYTLRFDSNGQRREFTVTVPATLTPVSEFVYPGESRTNTTTLGGSLTWSATGSVSLSVSGQSSDWTAPSTVGQVVRIAVNNGTTYLYQDYTVKDVLPVELQYQTSWEAGPDTLIAYPDGGRNPAYRTKTEEDFIPIDFGELRVTCADLAEYEALEAFHDEYMRSGDSFFIIEHHRDSRRTAVRFDSRLKAETIGCVIQVTFRLKNA